MQQELLNLRQLAKRLGESYSPQGIAEEVLLSIPVSKAHAKAVSQGILLHADDDESLRLIGMRLADGILRLSIAGNVLRSHYLRKLYRSLIQLEVFLLEYDELNRIDVPKEEWRSCHKPLMRSLGHTLKHFLCGLHVISDFGRKGVPQFEGALISSFIEQLILAFMIDASRFQKLVYPLVSQYRRSQKISLRDTVQWVVYVGIANPLKYCQTQAPAEEKPAQWVSIRSIEEILFPDNGQPPHVSYRICYPEDPVQFRQHLVENPLFLQAARETPSLVRELTG